MPAQSIPQKPPKTSSNAWVSLTLFSVIIALLLLAGGVFLLFHYKEGNLPEEYYIKEPKQESLIEFN